MIIQGAGPKTGEPIATSTSQSKMKKRGKVKNWSRKQLLMKQKQVMDKVLHVDARIEDLRNIFSEADETQRYLNLLAPDVQRVETIHRISVNKTNYAIH